MTELYVRTDTQFTAAVQNAQPGDTIYLAAGTYAPQLIKSLDSDIRITSLDPGDPAVLTGLGLRDVSGVSVSNVKMAAPEGSDLAFFVSGSENVSFDSIEVFGPNFGSGEEVRPFIIRDSSDVSVTNSEFHHVRHGVELLNVENVLIDGNSFHDIRTDGVRGGGVSNSEISNNTFTDFYPAPGDHPDAIQLWTGAEEHSSEHVKIIGNVIARGDGEPMQGIFLGGNGIYVPFHDLTVADNVVVGGLYHGIAMTGVIGGTVTGNVVAGLEDQKSWIRVLEDEGVTVSGNASTIFMGGEGRITPEGNTVLPERGLDYTLIVEKDGGSIAHLSANDVKIDLADLSGLDIPVSEVPDDAESPAQPDTPTEPETPTEETPSGDGDPSPTPDNPSDSDSPATPDHPSEPDSPDTPDAPSQPDPTPTQPEQGEGGSAPLPEETPSDEVEGRAVHVDTDAGLKAAIADAEPGDTIYLAAGTYSPLLIRSANSGITITSEDADNPAVLTGLTLREASGVEISNVKMEAPEGTRNAFSIAGSKDISFDAIDMSGATGIGSGKEVSPFIIRGGENISITNSQFHDAKQGIELLDVENVTIEGNRFFDLVAGGVRGAGVQNSQINDNHFTDFHAGAGSAAAIQFWTARQDASAENITIDGNVMARGDGDPMVGISIADNGGQLPFKNLVVTDNAVFGGAYNGIVLGNVAGGTVSGNVVAGFEDQLSGLRLANDHGVAVSGNTATAYMFDGGSEKPAGNTTIPENGVDYSAALSGDFAALKTGDLLDKIEGLVHQAASANVPSAPDLSIPETQTELRGTDGVDKLVGRGDNDLIAAGDGNDVVYGQKGDDHILGGGGNDMLYGHDGNDFIIGGDGDDMIDGANGNDVMTGGAGADYFLFRDGQVGNGSLDVVTDFDPNADKWLHLRGVDANVNTEANDRFNFVGTTDFSGTAGELNYSQHNDGVLVAGDIDGDGQADFGILLQGLSSISAHDFLL